jgi:hypothetical protein
MEEVKKDDMAYVKAPISRYWEEEVEVNKGAKISEKSNQRFIEVVVSGLKEDRDNEKFSEDAVEDMIVQFKSGSIGFFPDHGYSENSSMFGGLRYSWKQMMGVWVDAHRDGDNLKAVVRLNNAHPDANMFWNYIKEGMPIGFSIGGRSVEEPKEEWVEESAPIGNKE